MTSIKRQWQLVLVFLGVSLFFAAPVDAQRSGFIIGFGLGPGYYSASQNGASQSKIGAGIDFHLGGVLGNGLEIYWMQKAIYSGSDNPNIDIIASGVGGIGLAYPVSPTIDIHGGIGLGVWIEASSASAGTTTVSATNTEAEGLGLVGGARYKLNESGRWMLNLDVMYGKPKPDPDFSVLGIQLTINVMSH